jgi:Bacterial type II and III secretion system protein
MRTMWNAIFAVAALVGSALPLWADGRQVQIDVQLLSVTAEAAAKVGMNAAGAANTQQMFAAISENEKFEWLKKLVADGQAKVLAEPRMVTLDGKPVHFLSGGQQPYLSCSKGNSVPTIAYKDIGTSVDILPSIKADETVYLEAQVRVSRAEEGFGITTSFGFVPGFSERRVHTSAEIHFGSTFVLCMVHEKNESKPATCLFIFITPHILTSSPVITASVQEPVDHQVARISSVLVSEYRQACTAGNKELAAKLGRMALELDPLCLGQMAAPVVPRTLPAPMPAAPAKFDESDYRTPIVPPVREDEPESACPQPSEKEVLGALNAKIGSRKLSAEDIGDDIEIVCEKVMDKIDEPRFFPLVGPAKLHHCHWKCTVYYNETVRSNNPFPMVVKNKHVEVVYIDKDVFHSIAPESKLITEPIKSEELPAKQSFRERIRSLFKSSSTAGMTLPSGFYLQPKPQFLHPEPGPELQKEIEAIQEEFAKKQAQQK